MKNIKNIAQASRTCYKHSRPLPYYMTGIIGYKFTNFLAVEAGNLADSEFESCPVWIDQNIVSDSIIMGDMCTVGAMPTVTSEMVHVLVDNYIFLVANSGNKLFFVASDRMTSQRSLTWGRRYNHHQHGGWILKLESKIVQFSRVHWKWKLKKHVKCYRNNR